MITGLLSSRLAIQPDWATIILVFFAYSFLGNIMECVVLSVEKKRLVYNRGFAVHLPFSVIYGFGALVGYAVLSPLKGTWVPLFLVGAFSATFFELIVAQLQICLFGDFWWNYEDKPLNYKGILCLESSIGWGFAALVIVKFAHSNIVKVISRVPNDIAIMLATLLVALYILDFAVSAREARIRKTAEVSHQEAEVFGRTESIMPKK